MTALFILTRICDVALRVFFLLYYRLTCNYCTLRNIFCLSISVMVPISAARAVIVLLVHMDFNLILKHLLGLFSRHFFPFRSPLSWTKLAFIDDPSFVYTVFDKSREMVFGMLSRSLHQSPVYSSCCFAVLLDFATSREKLSNRIT